MRGKHIYWIIDGERPQMKSRKIEQMNQQDEKWTFHTPKGGE